MQNILVNAKNNSVRNYPHSARKADILPNSINIYPKKRSPHMSVKRLSAVTFVALGLLAQAALAQKAPSSGTHITVSKNGGGMYTTVQEAVNAARQGQVIEILDEAVYEEQVTIDGRAESPWTGVTGGKNGITIKYVPIAGNAERPAIKYRDTDNQSPKNSAESSVEGELAGQAGNFETCSAVRILYASGVTIEGIIIDGGGAAPFANPYVWDRMYPLVHGNAALTLVVSGGAQIRDCYLRNASFGVYVKDRNTGGVFGNSNPGDIDAVIPLSGFGKTGNHLFEHNRIHNNSTGIFFESSWDLGSTIRYNLFYDNFHQTGVTMPTAASTSDFFTSAIAFKDSFLSPVAIYNNTFFRNYLDIIGHWKVGAQHLIFNTTIP
jgi:hypothetical protein